MEKLQIEVSNLLGITLTARQLRALACYEQELITWNARANLTAIRQSQDIRTKHFLDSLSCILFLRDNPAGRLTDVGTGAGFPGIPLKIVLPALQVDLVESVGKKADFCRHIVSTLRLDGVRVIQNRAEEIGQMTGYREQCDWAVARAVANFPVLMEYLLPLVKIGGSAVVQKGESGPAETHAAERAIHLLGGRLRKVHQLALPGIAEERYLIVVDKVASTPPLYPRRVGIPAKKPLR